MNTTDHIDLEMLAELAEGTLPAAEAGGVRAHLEGCRACTAAYAEAVRYRAAWLAHPEAFAPAAAKSRVLDAVIREALGRPRPMRSGRLAAAAGLIAVAGLGWSLVHVTARPGELELPPVVRMSLAANSTHGLVLPGGEAFAARVAPELRAGAPDAGPDLEHAVDSLITAYESGRRSATESAALIVSLLATGDLDAARDYAHEALQKYPGDASLLVASADERLRNDDVRGAEALLRQARSSAGHDPLVALDLALVLRQHGETGESRSLLGEVSRSRVLALAERARRESRQTP